jgi:hypothetical protein
VTRLCAARCAAHANGRSGRLRLAVSVRFFSACAGEAPAVISLAVSAPAYANGPAGDPLAGPSERCPAGARAPHVSRTGQVPELEASVTFVVCF